MKNKKTAIICSLLFTACFVPVRVHASALNAKADPAPALTISDDPYTPPTAESVPQPTSKDSFVPPPASFTPAPATNPTPAPAAQLPEIKSANAGQTPALQISDEPYIPATASKTADTVKTETPAATNAKTLQTWVTNREPRKVPVQSATAQLSSPVVAKPAETIAWAPAIKTEPAADTPSKPEKLATATNTSPAHDEHYKQAV